MIIDKINTPWQKLLSRTGSIQKKLFISYMAVLLSLVLITGLMTASVLQNVLRREMLELKQKSVEQMKDKVELIVDHVLAVSNIYYISTEITIIPPFSETLSASLLHMRLVM